MAIQNVTSSRVTADVANVPRSSVNFLGLNSKDRFVYSRLMVIGEIESLCLVLKSDLPPTNF